MFLLLNKSLLTNLILPCGSGSGESEVTESCLTLRDPMDCSLTASSVHGIFQARILECVAISFSRGFFPSPEIKPGSPTLQSDYFPLDPPGKPAQITSSQLDYV